MGPGEYTRQHPLSKFSGAMLPPRPLKGRVIPKSVDDWIAAAEGHVQDWMEQDPSERLSVVPIVPPRPRSELQQRHPLPPITPELERPYTASPVVGPPAPSTDGAAADPSHAVQAVPEENHLEEGQGGWRAMSAWPPNPFAERIVTPSKRRSSLPGRGNTITAEQARLLNADSSRQRGLSPEDLLQKLAMAGNGPGTVAQEPSTEELGGKDANVSQSHRHVTVISPHDKSPSPAEVKQAMMGAVKHGAARALAGGAPTLEKESNRRSVMEIARGAH